MGDLGSRSASMTTGVAVQHAQEFACARTFAARIGLSVAVGSLRRPCAWIIRSDTARSTTGRQGLWVAWWGIELPCPMYRISLRKQDDLVRSGSSTSAQACIKVFR